MKKTNYVTPQIEVIEMELEGAILDSSSSNGQLEDFGPGGIM